MKKAIAIASWEFVEKVKKKSFFISVLITPLILIFVGYSTGIMGTTEKYDSPTPIGILDETGEFAKPIIKELNKFQLPDGQPQFIPLILGGIDSSVFTKAGYNAKLKSGEIYGFVYVTNNSDGYSLIQLITNGFLDRSEISNIQTAAAKSLLQFYRSNTLISRKSEKGLKENFNFELVELTDQSDREKEMMNAFFTGYIFIMLLVLMIIFAGGMFVRSLVEEKSNRIMEILLSSCKIRELLLGKIIGLSLLGFFQLIIWGLFGYFMQANNIISFNLEGAFVLQLVYFVLGYIIYTAIFVGLGSIVNSEHDAQQITSNISLILILPILISTQVIQSPDSLTAHILSYFPLTTAPVMILRMNIYSPQISEIILSLFVLIISIYLIIIVSSKIFRVGVLYYGKRPSFKELISWVKD